MKGEIRTLAAVLALAGAASANAALDFGVAANEGNGELFLNVWDNSASYTFDLNQTIEGFQTNLAAAGAINQTFALTNFEAFLTGVADTSALKFNLLATDSFGARRLLTTFTAPAPATTTVNPQIATAISVVNAFAVSVNLAGMVRADNISVRAPSTAWAGKPSMGNRIANLLNFDTFGSLANSSYASGLSFMRIDALPTGTALSTYTTYNDDNVFAGDFGSNQSVRVWIDVTDLHIAALDGIVGWPPMYEANIAPGNAIDFGESTVGAESHREIIIWNATEQLSDYSTLKIHDAAFSGPDRDSFRIANFVPDTSIYGCVWTSAGNGLPPFQCERQPPLPIDIIFSPNRVGAHNARLTLTTNDTSFGGTITYDLSAIAAVPEPGAYAMLLAGLSLVAVAGRRRSHKEAVSWLAQTR